MFVFIFLVTSRKRPSVSVMLQLNVYKHFFPLRSHHSLMLKPKTRCCGSVEIKYKANKSGGGNGTH